MIFPEANVLTIIMFSLFMLRNNKAIKRLNKSGSLRHQEKQSKRFQDWIQINVQGSIKSSVYIIVFHSGNVLVLFHFLSTIFSIEGKFKKNEHNN